MEGKRGLRFAAAFSFYLLVAAAAGGAAAGAGFAGLLHGHGVAAVHCGVDDGINVVNQVLAVALCLIVSSHTLVSHDLAIQVVDLGVQLGDALITALVLADLVVQIHAGQIELPDEILQLLILVVCLAGLIQSQVTGVSLQCHGGAQTALAAAGIKLFGGVSGDADKAVEAFINKTLDYNPDVKCSHHEHSHGEGHTCGEHGCGSHSCH